MTALASLLATLAVAPTGVFGGSSPQAPNVSLTVKGGVVVSASAWTNEYECDLGGNVGPASVSVRPNARISRKGHVSFTSGKRSRRLGANLILKKGKFVGKIRVSGTLGGPCSSPSIPVSLSRR